MDELQPSEWAAAISAEMSRASARYGAPASTHESYGVIAEEFAELFDAIRANDLDAVRREAIQVAASATRLYLACGEDRFKARSVK